MTMQQDNIIITNNASREQLEKIYDLLGEAFPIERAYFQTRLDFDSTYHPETTWFATVNGHIASNVQIFPLHIRVGQAVLKIGGMGSVATDPEYRGMGLAHRILNAQTEWMGQNEYDLSFLLASKHEFYEKVGWRLISESLYSMKAPTTSTSTSTSNDSIEIIPFEQRYFDDLRSIYEQFNVNRTYTVVRNEAYWNDMMQWPDWKQADCLLLRKDQEIVAYGIIEKHDRESVYLNEFVYLREAEEHVIDLFLALCQLRPHAKHIMARLPDDHKLIPYFYEHEGVKSPLNLAMWKMINYDATFRKLLPELQTRLNEHEQFNMNSLHVALQCEDKCLYLDYEKQVLSISKEENKAHMYQKIMTDQRELITCIMFGYHATTEEADRNAILQALFPKQNAVFYMTDKF